MRRRAFIKSGLIFVPAFVGRAQSLLPGSEALIANAVPKSTAAASSLLTDLKAYWKLDETSGTRYDSTANDLDLSQTNSPGYTTGKQGNAATFTASSSMWMEKSDTTLLETGDIDFTWAFWFYLSSSGTQVLFGKYTTTGDQREYQCFYQSGQSLRFQVSPTGSSTTVYVEQNNVTISTGTWYHCACGYLASSNDLWISINRGTRRTANVAAGTIFAGTSPFYVGRNSGGAYFDGYIDELGFWKRELTSGELDTLYNSGNGSTHPWS